MWVEFDRPMGRYEPGQRVNLHPSIAARALKINRAHRVDGPGGVETATRRPTEHAAARTRDPSRHGWEYVGSGWWQSPEGRKVRGRKDATVSELKDKL